MIPLRPFLPLLAAAGLLAQDAPPDAPADTARVEPTAEATAMPTADAAEAAEKPATEEEAIPHPFDAARYEAAWAKNPFLLKTAAVAQTTVSFAQDWALAGMYRSPSGKITVTLQNKQTNEFQRVTNEDNSGEFQLVEAKFNRNRNEASVVIAKGSQSAELKYDDTLVSKPVTINNTLRQGDATQGGQPGAAAPGKPGVPVSATGATPGRPGLPITRPGAAAGATAGATAGASPAVNPPSISRRRQLIPPPTVSPQPAP
jgi:hypothetical protein